MAPPPSWPPSEEEYGNEFKTFRVLFDPVVDRDREGKWRGLIERIRTNAPSGQGKNEDGGLERIKGKGKGKEILIRFEGKVGESEAEPCAVDLRKGEKVDGKEGDGMSLGLNGGVNGVRAKRFSSKSLRTEFVEVKYEVRLLHLLISGTVADHTHL